MLYYGEGTFTIYMSLITMENEKISKYTDSYNDFNRPLKRLYMCWGPACLLPSKLPSYLSQGLVDYCDIRYHY